ncbi:hypothetical protein Fcan01_22222 [Folsomia candida]|uniref:Uncharacterized protein n=1 Tax=Folsomia candida TaxID=158441 RepID=A0A226DEY3_FOLCA|nr:hypothetical protein Fcan01_22222 [Folsomia candida]
MVDETEFLEGSVLIPKTFPDLDWAWFNSVPRWYWTYWSKVDLIRSAAFMKQKSVGEVTSEDIANPNNCMDMESNLLHGFGLKDVPFKLVFDEEKTMVFGEGGTFNGLKIILLPAVTVDDSMVEIYYRGGGNLLPRRWKSTTAAVEIYYRGGGNLLPRRWKSTTAAVEIYYRGGGNLLPRRWKSTTAAVVDYRGGGAIVTAEVIHKHHVVFSDNATFAVGVTTWKDGETSWVCWNTKQNIDDDLKEKVLEVVTGLGFKAEMAVETVFKE